MEREGLLPGGQSRAEFLAGLAPAQLAALGGGAAVRSPQCDYQGGAAVVRSPEGVGDSRL